MTDTGSPLAVAVLGVSSLANALPFYRDVIGLSASPEVTWRGMAFERHFALPPGSSALAVMLSAPWTTGNGPQVGRVLALEFNATDRKRIAQPGDRTYRGLWNLNFYVDDIRATTKALQARGFNFWSEPVGYEVSAEGGSPVEVLFDGPDNLAINLVELTGGPTSTIGKLRAEVDTLGKSSTGFTQVSTTSHSIIDYTKAFAFYSQVLGMTPHLDAVLAKPETNHFLNRPRDAQTRATFMAGAHQFGKVALSHPLNYTVPDRTPLAVAPNIGYLAQGFCVPSLAKALERCALVGAHSFSAPVEIEIPGIGPVSAAMVRNPGSGALMQLFEGER